MASAMRSESDKESLIAFPSSCINSLRRSSKISPFLLGYLSPEPPPFSMRATLEAFQFPHQSLADSTRIDCSGPVNAPQVLYRLKASIALMFLARYRPYAFSACLLQGRDRQPPFATMKT